MVFRGGNGGVPLHLCPSRPYSFSREHNSWEVASDVKAPDLVAEYYRRHPATPRHIRQTDFDILFKSRTIALRRSNLGGGVNVRGPLTR